MIDREELSVPVFDGPAWQSREKLGRWVLGAVGLLATSPVFSADAEPVVLPLMLIEESAVPPQSRTELGELTPDTPRSGSVVSREELERVQFIDSVNELLNRVPGTAMTRNIRIPIGGRSYTGNLIDGQTPKSPHQLGTYGFIEETNTWDIERVEITRGPGSVLNSSNAIGGTINVITRTPPVEPEYRVWGQVGQWDLYRGGVSAGGTFDNGVGYLADVNSLRDRGWRENSRRERDAASGTLQFSPTAATRLRVRMEYLDVYDEDPGNLSEADFRANWRQAAVTHDVLSDRMRHFTPSLRLTQDVGDFGELRIGYIRRESEGSQVTQGFGAAAAAALRQTDKDYTENNLQVVYRHDFELADGKIYVGADLIQGTKKDDQHSRIDRRRADLITATTIRERGRSPFLQYEFSPMERLRLTAGLRHEDFGYRVDRLSFDRFGNPVVQQGRSDYSKLVRKAGAVYAVDDATRLWVNVSEGFRVPDTGSTVTATYPNPDLAPETMLTKEIGLRGAIDRVGLDYDLTLYQTTIKGYHLSVPCLDQPSRCEGFSPMAPGANRATFTDAVGRMRFRGFEATAGWQARDWLRFEAAYTHAKSKLLDYVSGGADLTGNSLNAMPRHRLNARVTVNPTPVSYVELEADYLGRYYTNLENTDRYKRPTLYNLRAGYDFNNWQLSLQVLNLLDTKYPTRVSQSGGERIYNAGYAPRTLRAGLSYRW